MSRMSPYLGIAFLLIALSACKKETESPEAPPVSVLRTYDIVPVSVEQDGTGYLVACKRALSDPQLAYAQRLGSTGDPATSLEFGGLRTRVENIDFALQDIVITDVLPWGDGTYLVCGFAIETQRDDRLHAVVYRVDENGVELSEPFRRYIGSDAVLVRNNDLNELYRTRVLAVKDGNGDLLLATRYETELSAVIRLQRIPMGSLNTPAQVDLPLTDIRHRLQFLDLAPNGQILLGHDVEGGAEPQVLSISTWTISTAEITAGAEGRIDLREALVTSLIHANGELRITGTYDSGFDEPRTFQATGADVAGLIATPVNTGGGRAAISYASLWSGGSQLSALNEFESGVLGPEAERNDRISDLSLCRIGTNGELSDVRSILPGQGARAIGCFESASGTVMIGALHPFLNTDYLHTFYLVVED